MPWRRRRRGVATRKPSVCIVIGRLIAFLVGVRYFNNCVIINAHEPGAKIVFWVQPSTPSMQRLQAAMHAWCDFP